MADDGDFHPRGELFNRDVHIRYLEMNYQILPTPYESQEINHLTLAYFIIYGLNILHAIDRYGGFSKFPRQMPDLYHSYYGFTALSMLQEIGLNSLNIELGISTLTL